MSKGNPVGTPVGKGPWAVGTWLWHIRTKKGPWVVVKDDGGSVVYVDSTPNNPATTMDARKAGTSHKKLTISHPDVSHHYRSMLTDKEPKPAPSWTSKVDWERFGFGVGSVIILFLVSCFFLFIFWLEIGAPH
jgi:hypothetical protein